VRIPDAATADALIEGRHPTADCRSTWAMANPGVNARWAFMLSGRVLTLDDRRRRATRSGAWCGRLGEPVIRTGVRRGMHCGAQFVMDDNRGSSGARGKAPPL